MGMFNFVVVVINQYKKGIMENDLSDKQWQIMEKSLEVFAEKGFDSTSVRDIAQRAHVNVAMISYYFGSKEKLLEAIFLNYTSQMSRKIGEIIHSKEHEPLEKVDLIIDTYIDVIQENKSFHTLMMREQVMLKKGPLYASIKNMKRQNHHLMEVAVKSGQKAGIFQDNIDIGMLAVTLVGAVNHFFSNYKYICENKEAEAIADSCMHWATDIEKLKTHLKTMFRAFLTYKIPSPRP